MATTAAMVTTVQMASTVPDGSNGKSAYELYVDTTEANPVLTFPEWKDSLKGKNGTNGNNGDKGDKGDNGSNG